MTVGRRGDVGAAVDIGSNSVHVLVAALADHGVEPLLDESAFLGLGDAVHDGGALGGTGRAALSATLARFAHGARALGATSITFVGTEPLRRAADGARIVHDVERATGAPLHVLSHEEEAHLTVIGVTMGRPVAHETLVVDIGGGSSEFALVGPDRPATAVGLQLGSARITSGHASGDPPAGAEVAAMTDAARASLGGLERAAPREIVAVGGTATNLLKVLPAAVADRVLTLDRLAEIQAILATEPAATVTERYVVNPVRARLLPAGAAIAAAILEHYGLDRMRVSDASLREGAILAVRHAGPCWRDHLATLAQGWRS